MEHSASRALYDALNATGHPRNDWRTEEAKRYTEWMEAHIAPYLAPGCRLLDLGCGPGKMTFKAETLGAEAIGIDHALVALRLARDIAKDVKSDARFVRGDYCVLPFADASIDVAIFPKNLVECSYDDAERLAGEIHRVLAPGGRLVLTMNDGIRRALAKGVTDLASYASDTGKHEPMLDVPGQGAFAYPTYFWTVAFAIHVIERHLDLERCERLDDALFLLVFRRAV